MMKMFAIIIFVLTIFGLNSCDDKSSDNKIVKTSFVNKKSKNILDNRVEKRW